MKLRPTKPVLTFGEFIAAAYDACDKHQAEEVVQFAVNEHLVAFHGQQRVVISSASRGGFSNPRAHAVQLTFTMPPLVPRATGAMPYRTDERGHGVNTP